MTQFGDSSTVGLPQTTVVPINEDGDAVVVNNNDCVDDSNGETRLIRFKKAV
ncbi:MAG: hypothetical protein ABW116_14035 [Candidatus Sedimenticola sp. 20ELBAFRAG]